VSYRRALIIIALVLAVSALVALVDAPAALGPVSPGGAVVRTDDVRVPIEVEPVETVRPQFASNLVPEPQAPLAQIASSSLPPVDTPLKEVVDELEARAARGDNEAACRLSMDLAKCRMLPEARDLAARELATAARAEPGSIEEGYAARRVSQLQLTVASGEALCAGLDSKRSAQAWRYLLQAANGGHVDSMLRFAIQPPLSESSFALDIEGWAAYRDHAIPLLERAASLGSSLAVYHLYRGYSGMSMPAGIEAARVDPVRAYAYLVLLHRGAAPKEQARIAVRLDQLRAALTPEQFGAAQTVANSFDVRQFAPRTEDSPSFASLNFPQTPEECESAP